jgi:hypothetical protein
MAIAYLSRKVNNDVVDYICKKIHEENIKSVLFDVKHMPSIVEKALKYNKDPFIWLANKKYNVKCMVEEWVNWNIVLLMINNIHIIVINGVMDNDQEFQLLLEGFIEDKNLKIDRFYYKIIKLDYVVEYNSIQDVVDISHLKFVEIVSFIYKVSGIEGIKIDKKWYNPDIIFTWFLNW